MSSKELMHQLLSDQGHWTMKYVASAFLVVLTGIIWNIDRSMATPITIHEPCELDEEGKFLKADTIVEVRPTTASFWKHGSFTTTEKRLARPDRNLPAAFFWSDPLITKQSASGNVWTFEFHFRARTVLDATYAVQRSFKGELQPGAAVSLRKSCTHPTDAERRLPPTRAWRRCRIDNPLPNQGLTLKGVVIQDQVAEPSKTKSIILYLTSKRHTNLPANYSRNLKYWYQPGKFSELKFNTVAYCKENLRRKEMTAEQQVQFKRLQSRLTALEESRQTTAEPPKPSD